MYATFRSADLKSEHNQASESKEPYFANINEDIKLIENKAEQGIIYSKV